MKHIGSYEAKTHLPDILRHVESGESYVITRHGKPIAKIQPFSGETVQEKNPWDFMREAAGKMSEDFFPDFEAYRKELDERPGRKIEPLD